MCSLSPPPSSSSSSFIPSLRERYELLHAIVLKEFEARGWDIHAGAELSQLSDLLSQAIDHEQQQQQPLSLSSPPPPQPTQAVAKDAEAALPAADSDVQEAASDGFQAPETFVDDDSSDGSDGEDGQEERSGRSCGDSGDPPAVRVEQPPPSSPPARPAAAVTPPPCPSTSSSSPSSALPKTPLPSPARCPPSAARGLTGRSVRRLQRLLSPSAALPSTPISETLRRLILDDSADLERAEELKAVETGEESSSWQQQREQLPHELNEEEKEACEKQESSVPQPESELQPGMDGEHGRGHGDAQPEEAAVTAEAQPDSLFVRRLEEAVQDEEHSPALTTRRARTKRIAESDEDEDADCRHQPLSPLAAVRPLQELTSGYLNRAALASRLASQSPAPKQRLPAVFATPAPRPPSSRVLTRSVSRSAGGQQRRRRDGWTEEEQLSFFSTPVRDRIRLHREQLLRQRQPELQEGDEQVGDEEEAEDVDAESEGEVDWIVDDDDGVEGEEGEQDDDDGGYWQPPPPSPSPRRSPACSPPAASPSSSPSQPRLTRSNRDALARQLFLSFNSAAFDSLLPAELELCFSNRLLSTAGFCSMRLRGSERVAAIQLAAKVVDDTRRLRLTLAHEMCHAAAWIVDGISRPPHGRAFRRWAARCERRLQGVRVSTCHRYDIHYRWRYQCSNAECGRVVGRHTDSLDTGAALCGCGHPLVSLGAFNRDNTPCRQKLNGFALFVKQRYAQLKREGAQHRDVMAELSRLYREEQRLGDGEAAEAAPAL